MESANDMAFDLKPEDIEEPQPDLELLEMQKRKSVPHFVVSEFVEQIDDDLVENSDDDEQDTPDEAKVAKDLKSKDPSFKKPRLEKQMSVHKEVTHVDVKNVSIINFCFSVQCWLENIILFSPNDCVLIFYFVFSKNIDR